MPEDREQLLYFQPRVMRHRIDEGRCEYAIHDVFFDADGNVETYTSAARSNRFGTVAELKAWILEVLPKAQNGITCGDLGYSHSANHFSHWLQHVDHPVIDYDGVAPAPPVPSRIKPAIEYVPRSAQLIAFESHSGPPP